MKLQEVDINRAQGLRLCEEITINNTLLPKNHILTDDDINALKQLDIKTFFGAKAETGDIDFDTALGVIAAKLSGKGLGFRVDERGFCEIAATADGLFETYNDRLNKFSRFSHYFILNTIKPFQLVKKGDIVARLEILIPIIPQETVDELVFYLSGNESLLCLQELKETNATILYTHLYNDENEADHLSETADKITENYQPLQINFSYESSCLHDFESIEAELDALLKIDNEFIFIIPSVRCATTHDILYQAISRVTDEILCAQIPLLGGSDLIVATKKQKRIIALPYNYAYVDAPVLENFIKIAVTKAKLSPYDFKHTENPIIENISHLKDTSHLIKGNATDLKNKANIAAVVLAAGQSKRLNKNKLLTELGTSPLVLNAVQAAIQSDASPVFVVTGYQADEIETALEDFDINIVYNPNYYTGVKTSINLGIKSVPDFCDGVMLIPADMPGLTAEFLNKMIAKFKKKQDNQLVIAENKGVKCNPIIWSKSLYQKADLVAENADVRPVFMEHADYTTAVKGSVLELIDVNFQNDLDTVLKNFKA